MVKNNSVQAFLKQVESGKRQTVLIRAYKFFEAHPGATRRDLEKALKIEPTTASARVSDLQDIGVLQEYGNRQSPNQTPSSRYIVQKEPGKIQENRLKRKREKYIQWLKRGLGEFKSFMPNSTITELKTHSIYGNDY